jgi:hypothetical protein
VFIGGAAVFGVVGVGLLVAAAKLYRKWHESVQVDLDSGKFILRWRAGWYVLYEYRYALEVVRELRLTRSADAEDDEASGWSLWDHADAMWDADGRLLFRYGAARVAFADGLSTRQATRVLDALAAHAPEIIDPVEPVDAAASSQTPQTPKTIA